MLRPDSAAGSSPPGGEPVIGSEALAPILLLLLATSAIVLVTLAVAPPRVATFHVVEGGAWLFVLGAAVLAWRMPPHSRALLVLLALLTLLYVISPPGGWFDRCCPDPVWGGSDGAFYWEAGRRVVSGQDPWADSGYLYPPPVAQLFAFMCRFGPGRSLGMWTWVMLASYIACVTMTYAIGLQRSRSPRIAIAVAGLLWLVNRPALVSAADHQANLPVLALLLLAWAAFETHPAVSAFLVALGGMVKIAPILVAAFAAVVKRRWLLVFLPAMAVVLVGAYLMSPPLWQIYVRQAGQLTAQPRGISLDVAALQLLPSMIAQPLTVLAKLVLLAYGVWILAQSRKVDRATRMDVSFAMGVWSMALLPPTVWSHYLLWFTPALLVSWLYLPRRSSLWLAVLTAFTLWMPVLPPPVGSVGLLALGVAILVLLRSCLPDIEGEPRTIGEATDELLRVLGNRSRPQAAS